MITTAAPAHVRNRRGTGAGSGTAPGRAGARCILLVSAEERRLQIAEAEIDPICDCLARVARQEEAIPPVLAHAKEEPHLCLRQILHFVHMEVVDGGHLKGKGARDSLGGG